jgi:hypothetical protein
MTSTTFFFIFVPILAIILLAVNLIFAPHNPNNWPWKSIRIWGKLSNSGEALKLLIPSNYWKIFCGWTNHSCKVTSQKIYESSIGDHGSKSAIPENIAVKEQRVDGSWYGLNSASYPYLRCTLVGFERNYRVKIHSNPINLTRNSSNLESKLNPWYVTGFTDGEGSFILTIIKDNKYKLGWRAACRFVISLNKKDLKLLNSIKEFFGVGNVFLMGKGSAQYRVESLEGLAIIINHFDKYSLITKKQADYALFKLAHSLIKNKSHLTEKGLLELVALKAVLNNGLSNDLSIAFPDIVPALRPETPLPKVRDPLWLVGFTDAEGCFSVIKFKSQTSKLGEAVKLSFILTQSIRDEDLMKSLIEYLGCGNTTLDSRGTIDFKVTNFTSIRDIIIPFFDKYRLQGNKSLDFSDFSEVVTLMENKLHLTKEGLDKIKIIQNRMNTNRKQ